MTKKCNASYGIDFGTTNSSVVCYMDGKVIPVPIDLKAENPVIVRSVIYISRQNEFLFGKDAIEAYIEDVAKGKAKPPKTIWTGKYVKIARFTANGYAGEDIMPELLEVEVGSEGRLIQSLKSALSSKSVSEFSIFDNTYPLEELIGRYLRHLKTKADKFMKCDVENVVLGRPVHFVGDDDKLALKRLLKAARYAGFENIKFELEPIGAAWDYKVNTNKKSTVLIFDFGGGTLDYSIVSFPQGAILANHGLAIGGDYFNSKIFDSQIADLFGKNALFSQANLKMPDYIYEYLGSWYKISLLKTKNFLDSLEHFRSQTSDISAIENLESLVFNNLGFALYEEVEKNKKLLSRDTKVLFEFNKGKIDITKKIHRAQFESTIKLELDQIWSSLNEVLDNANLSHDQIDVVVTTGGSSLIPIVRKLLSDMFSKDKLKRQDTFTSVATGLGRRSGEFFIAGN